jgi:carboxylesterase type B
LIGNNNFESGFYQTAAFATGKSFNASQQALFNLEAFTCASSIEASNRAGQVSVYRYRYFGDFANLRLFPGSGTDHGTELDMVFGTAQDVSGLPNDEVEIKTIAYFQKAWATFSRDPENGLSKSMGWPLYRNTTGK